MDPTRPIVYRGFDFNTLVPVVGRDALAGCEVKRVTYGGVEVVGYTEKSSLRDGHDATDVYLGRRRISLQGNVYGETRGDLYDRLRAMRYAISPTLAFKEDPRAKGYLPLSFYEPTGDLNTWPDGVIPLMLRARAITGVDTTFDRDIHGGDDGAPLSSPYSVTFEAIDPRAYHVARVDVPMSGAGGDVELSNRGGYPTPLNALIVVPASVGQDTVWTLAGLDEDVVITIPDSNLVQVVRYDAQRKQVSLSAGTSAEELRMDLVPNGTLWASLEGGVTPLAWTFKKADGSDGNLMNTSRMYYREAFV